MIVFAANWDQILLGQRHLDNRRLVHCERLKQLWTVPNGLWMLHNDLHSSRLRAVCDFYPVPWQTYLSDHEKPLNLQCSSKVRVAEQTDKYVSQHKAILSVLSVWKKGFSFFSHASTKPKAIIHYCFIFDYCRDVRCTRQEANDDGTMMMYDERTNSWLVSEREVWEP